MIDVFIVGAQKAGTTSILRYLSEHPSIVSHPQMELGFFSLDEEYSQGEKILKKKYGLQSKAEHIILAKQANFSSDKKAIERLASLSPNCKLIFLTREPISRAFSSYQMIKKGNVHNENFDDVINNGLSNPEHWHFRHIIGYGCYSDLLNNLLVHFKRDQIKVVKFETLKKSPQEVVNEIQDWLGLKQFSITPKVHNSKNTTSLDPLKKVFGNISAIKRIAIRILGYKLAKKTAQMVSKIVFNPNKVVKESLSDYPQTKKKLAEFYFDQNNDLKSWGIEY